MHDGITVFLEFYDYLAMFVLKHHLLAIKS